MRGYFFYKNELLFQNKVKEKKNKKKKTGKDTRDNRIIFYESSKEQVPLGIDPTVNGRSEVIPSF